MPDISYDELIEVPIEEVWEFAKDIKNWAPFLKYYESLEELNDRESIWTVKGEVGPFTRTTKMRVIITEWMEKQRVAFELEGINEPIKGSGNVSLNSHGGESRIPGSTTVSITLSVKMEGTAGVLMNRLISPMLKPTAKDLLTKFTTAVTERHGVPVKKPDIEKAGFMKRILSKLKLVLKIG